jgi:hypothetical protein
MRYVLPRRRTTCVPPLALSDLSEFLTFMPAPFEARFPLAVLAELHDSHDLRVVLADYQPIGIVPRAARPGPGRAARRHHVTRAFLATTLTAGLINRAAATLIPRLPVRQRRAGVVAR